MYGIIIGLISAGLLAASMVMIKKVHEEEPTALFSLMFILSLSGAFVLIIPSLIFNPDNLYPTTFTDCLYHSLLIFRFNRLITSF